ncbi:hypothetical protein [Comamonas aquatica]|uniref:hypothetical protein n=1 Tax=Comamonas aquatica TaxID=225991 RepID=UPI0021B12971|nr:hypothetical protein [Comamonas aquatica]
MNHTKKPDITGCLTLGQLNHAIRPLKITSEGLAAYGFEPATTYMGAKYYRAALLPQVRRTLALGALWPEGEVLIKALGQEATPTSIATRA